jgi:hypothetical protein
LSRRLPLLLAAATLLAVAAPSAHAAQAPCDAACLKGLAERYMDALVARTPDALPWARAVAYSENRVPMDIGDGTWGTVTGRSKTALEVADPKNGQVAWIGEIEEHGQPAFYALRMKVVAGKIAGLEATIRRRGGPPEYSDPAAWTPDPAFAETEKTRLSREQLIAVVNGYMDAMQGKTAAAKFAPGCGRKVNGVVVTKGKTATGGVEGCAAQIKAGVFKPIAKVRDRRFVVVDEAKGIVIASGFEDYPELQDVYAGRPAPATYPYSLGFLAAFKIRDGGVYCVEQISTALPYLMPAP